MTRYQVREFTPSGYGREFHTERLSTVNDIILALGGEWRVRRQYRTPAGRWFRDGGRQPEWTQGLR